MKTANVGDWLVAFGNADLDVGRIAALGDEVGMVEVAWDTGTRTTIDLVHDKVEIFTERQAAVRFFNEKRVAQ